MAGRGKLDLLEALEPRRLLSAAPGVPVYLAASTAANNMVVEFNAGSSTYSISGGSAGTSEVTAASLDLTLQGDGGTDSLTINGGDVTLENDPGADGTQLAVSLQSGSLQLASSEHFSSLNIAAGATATIGMNGEDVLVVGGLTNNGQLNLNNNDMIVRNGDLSQIAGQTRPDAPGGMISSCAGSSVLPVQLGVAVNNDGAGNALYSTFDGQAVGADDVLVKYTYTGDADLNGVVNSADQQLLLQGFAYGATTWAGGDFNKDGLVDGSDFSLFDAAMGAQAPALAPAVSGSSYSLSLPTKGFDANSTWIINWGDGMIDHLTGNPGAATHQYSISVANATMDIAVAGTNSSGATVAIPARSLLVYQPGGLPLPALVVTGPSSNPALPAGMNSFTPPGGSMTVAGSAPTIATADVTAGPADSISLTGLNFSAIGDGSDSSFLVYAETDSTNGSDLNAGVQDVTSTGAMITLSAAEPADSMYVIWPQNSTGPGLPVAVNQTEAHWISNAGVAEAGQTMSVYGQNLSGPGGQSWVYLQPAGGGAGVWASVTNVNPYKVDFTVPAGLSGAYQVWTNNGLGGQYSWSGPLALTVNAATSWDPTKIVNVKNFGAVGDGVTNDAAAVLAAATTLTAGDTLYFPTGTYLMGGQQLVLPGDIRVLGDGSADSQLIFTGAAAHSTFGAFEIGFPDYCGSNSEIESLGAIYQGSDTNSSLLFVGHSSNVNLDNLLLFGNTLTPVDIQGSSQLTVTNSSLEGLDVNAYQTHDMSLNNDSFHLAHYAQAAITVVAAYDMSMTNCTVADEDESDNTNWDGWGQGRLMEDNLYWGSIYNQYIAGNTTEYLGAPGALAAAQGQFNCGEQVNIEGALDIADGTAQAVGNDTVTLSSSTLTTGWSLTNIGPGIDVFVTGGTGLGQMRIVTAAQLSADGQSITLTLNQPWTLQPDSTSQLAVSDTAYNSVFYQNTLRLQTGINGLAAEEAGTGFEIWTGGYNLVFDSNTTNNVNTGVLVASFDVHNPSYFIQITNNTFNNSQGEAIGFIDDGLTPHGVGDVVRNNIVQGGPIGIALSLNTMYTSTMELAVVEQNTVNNCPIAIQLGDEPDTFVYDNTLIAGSADASGSVGVLFEGPVEAGRLQGNTIQGFGQTYDSTTSIPAAINLLTRTVVLDTAQSTDLSASVGWLNDGIAAINWTASSNVNWLSISVGTGTTADGADSLVQLTANPAGLSAGTYEATVTFSADGLSENMLVWLAVV